MKTIRNNAGTRLAKNAETAIIAILVKHENICLMPNTHEAFINDRVLDWNLDSRGKTKTVTMIICTRTGS